MSNSILYSRILKFTDVFTEYVELPKLVEELNEAGAEASRLINRKATATRLKLVEELADVFIVGMQIIALFDKTYKPLEHNRSYQEAFWDCVAMKVKRTEERIKTGYYNVNPMDETGVSNDRASD